MKDANSRPLSPIRATTTTSASVLFVIIDRRTDLPTPEPATIPTLCPRPSGKRALIFLIPTSKTSVMGCRSNGLTRLPLRLFLSESVNLQFDTEGRVSLTEKLLNHANIKNNILFVGLGKTFQIWEPKMFEKFKVLARKKAYQNRSNLKWENKQKGEIV